MTELSFDDIFRLLKTVNSAAQTERLSDSHLQHAMEVWWPQLENNLKNLPLEEKQPSRERSDREILEELLGLVRSGFRALSARTGETREPTIFSQVALANIERLISKFLMSRGHEVRAINSDQSRKNVIIEATVENGIKLNFVLSKHGSGVGHLLARQYEQQYADQKISGIAASSEQNTPARPSRAIRAVMRGSGGPWSSRKQAL